MARSPRCLRQHDDRGPRDGSAMTSEAKIAANRRNAQRSTGPRTALAKARVRRNALRHGLAAVVMADPDITAEVQRIAAAILNPKAPRSDREQAQIFAKAQVALRRVRSMRAQIMEEMTPPTPKPDS